MRFFLTLFLLREKVFSKNAKNLLTKYHNRDIIKPERKETTKQKKKGHNEMTIKEIKQKYDGRYGHGEKMTVVTYDYRDGNGKVAIITTYIKSYGRTVWQAVRVSDGQELIENGRCRPCDNLDDAIDVAGEMMTTK